MQVVSKEICFCSTIVAVVHPKKRDLSLFRAAFSEIGDDADAVFVVVEQWT